jgi:hypothetical protein
MSKKNREKSKRVTAKINSSNVIDSAIFETESIINSWETDAKSISNKSTIFMVTGLWLWFISLAANLVVAGILIFVVIILLGFRYYFSKQAENVNYWLNSLRDRKEILELVKKMEWKSDEEKIAIVDEFIYGEL